MSYLTSKLSLGQSSEVYYHDHGTMGNMMVPSWYHHGTMYHYGILIGIFVFRKCFSGREILFFGFRFFSLEKLYFWFQKLYFRWRNRISGLRNLVSGGEIVLMSSDEFQGAQGMFGWVMQGGSCNTQFF